MIAQLVARGFGTFGGGANLLPTRGYGIGGDIIIVAGPYYFIAASLYVAGASRGGVYCAGASAGQVTTE